MKERLENWIRLLLDSALARETQQGVQIYRHLLQSLQEATSESQIHAVHASLLEALAGMEAHGHFTNEEHSIVREIREASV